MYIEASLQNSKFMILINLIYDSILNELTIFYVHIFQIPYLR